ncbi:MAG: ABC transporter permease [Bacteroidetes bacterium 4572_112]|nr:MAG: ABC transporter permease [Bacteroidetes bacterium 4572_112]
MNKIWLVIQREYLTRVQKKSFIIMSILGPVLMAALMIVPVYLAKMSDEVKTVGIVDESGFFIEAFENTEKIKFNVMHMDIDDAKKAYETMSYDMVLYIPEPAYTYPSKIFIYSSKEPGMLVENYIRSSINNDLRTMRLKDAGVSKDVISAMKNKINLRSISIDDTGKEEERSGTLNLILGFVLALSIYFFIFMYGTQVMRGVLEEKTSRIIEVIISSIKPFQLMMGKIIGIAFVGLTQLLLWVILTGGIVTAVQSTFSSELEQVQQYQAQKTGQMMDPSNNVEVTKDYSKTTEFLSAILSIDFKVIIGSFLFYFLFGYLLYGALFAAVGSAVDNETDTQQFIMPITIPLILSIVSIQSVANNPDGPLAFWLSMIPFTSPVSMMVRIPYGVPYWQLGLSMLILTLSFVLFTWFAGKIYRIGILMYGKKPSYKEIWKWIKYS